MEGFPRDSDGKESACNPGDLVSIEGNGYSLQYSCLRKVHGQRSLVGYSPWGFKESDTTEQLTLPFSLFGEVGLGRR